MREQPEDPGEELEWGSEAGGEPQWTEGPHWGWCGEAAARCQERGSRALTALLPQEHQLEFPQRIPEVSARGHDGAGGAAAAASAHRPLPDRCSSNRLTKRAERKGSRRVLSAPAGPGEGARLKGARVATDRRPPPPPRRVA